MHGHMSRCTVTCHDARSHVTMQHGHTNVKKPSNAVWLITSTRFGSRPRHFQGILSQLSTSQHVRCFQTAVRIRVALKSCVWCDKYWRNVNEQAWWCIANGGCSSAKHVRTVVGYHLPCWGTYSWDGTPWKWRRRAPKRIEVLVKPRDMGYERWSIKCCLTKEKYLAGRLIVKIVKIVKILSSNNSNWSSVNSTMFTFETFVAVLLYAVHKACWRQADTLISASTLNPQRDWPKDVHKVAPTNTCWQFALYKSLNNKEYS